MTETLSMVFDQLHT